MDYQNDPELRDILSRIDKFSEADLEKTVNCNGNEFKVKDTYFIQFKNEVITECPPRMFKDPKGLCKPCMYECAECSSANTCESCITGYLDCGKRCFDTSGN